MQKVFVAVIFFTNIFHLKSQLNFFIPKLILDFDFDKRNCYQYKWN